ncbi:MAG: DegQ family serine endoprotease [Arenicellales bacterium]
MSKDTFRSKIHGARGGWLRRSVVAAAIGATILAGGGALIANAKPADPGPISPPAVQAPVPGLANLVAQVRPAVVSIVVQGHLAGAEGPRFEGDQRFRDFFEHFFGQQPGAGFGQDGGFPAQHFEAAGSGFIISADGFVVTNNHVVDHADQIKVILDDGTKLNAKLKGTDPKTDLALLKVDAHKPLPYVQFGSSKNIRAGDWVVAIGNPFGLGGTVTTGIVSARGRDLNSGPYDDFLQIDAPINKGNSGGPLFNLKGKVIGVNTAIFSPNGGNVGIGFAIPSNEARTVISSLEKQGYVARGELGVQIQTVTPDLAKGLGLEKPRGAIVSQVAKNSPAAKAGLQVGDVIVGFNGHHVNNARELPSMVANAGPGAQADVTVLRDGKRHDVHVTLASQGQTVAKANTGSATQSSGPQLGVAAAPVNDQTRARYNVPDSVTGALIVEVQPGSPAARAGLRPGDVIRKVNGKPVESPQALATAVHNHPKGMVMLVNRAGKQWFMSVRPETVG